jgi:hypothetical protein
MSYVRKTNRFFRDVAYTHLEKYSLLPMCLVKDVCTALVLSPFWVPLTVVTVAISIALAIAVALVHSLALLVSIGLDMQMPRSALMVP